MKFLLPTLGLFAASSFCCCGSLIEQLEKLSGKAPTDGRVMVPLPANELVRIVDIDSSDAYFGDKVSLVGRACTLDTASNYEGDGWQGGAAHCGTDSYYFARVAYQDMGPAPVPVVTPVPTPVDGGGLGTRGRGAGTGRATGSLPAGEHVKILDISPEDAYYQDRATVIGLSCTLTDASTDNGDGWQGGAATCDGGTSYYFFKAAYQDLGAGTAPVADGRIDHQVPAGARVKVIDIATDDAYYSDKASIVGKLCTLSEASSFKEGGWQGGQVSCDDGVSYYFYKAAYGVAGDGALADSGGRRARKSLPKGTRVKVVDVDPEDAYYSDRAGIIGKTCSLDEDSSFKDGGWQGGPVHCTDGSDYYFYKAAYQAL